MGKIILYLLVVVIIGFFVFWISTEFRSTGERVEKKEMANFIASFDNILQKQIYKYDAVKEQSFALPADVELVCFVDKEKDVNPYVNNELNSYIEIYPDYNMFFFPDNYDPEQIENMELEENPLCIGSHGKISLSFTGKGSKTLVKAINNTDKELDCVTVLYNGDPQDKLDLIFLGNDYENLDDFSEDVSKYVNNLFLKTKPFDTNMDKINFYRIDQFRDLGCKITSYILCNEYKTKQLASNCPNDYIFILTDISKIKDFVMPIRSSAISNIAHINPADNELVLLHEFGHTFGRLADEYVDESYYKNFNEDNYPNCDSAGCEEWSSLGDGCFKGCSVSQFFRPTKESIMRNYFKSEEYGIVNEQIISERLNVYS